MSSPAEDVGSKPDTHLVFSKIPVKFPICPSILSGGLCQAVGCIQAGMMMMMKFDIVDETVIPPWGVLAPSAIRQCYLHTYIYSIDN